ncbi:MAG: DMT family transporter [Pseudomonadota bacterium]|nr:DMT family transporter [Pseudomonadota bacterium]
MRTVLYTALALLAFAGNSVLCRLALIEHTGIPLDSGIPINSHTSISSHTPAGQSQIDPHSFTALRLISGAITLFLLSLAANYFRAPRLESSNPGSSSGRLKSIITAGSWSGALALFVYAAAFSWAYVSLDTASGALILFGCVQLTMILYSRFQGAAFPLLANTGIALAFTGLLVLFLPAAMESVFPVAQTTEPMRSTPDVLTGALLMAISGVAWAAYTLIGQRSTSALADTTGNFLRATPMALLLMLIVALFTPTQGADFGFALGSPAGIGYALASGVLASGAGYAIWYAVLPRLTVGKAASLQLTVPLIAAFGGLLFAGEALTWSFAGSAILVLGGVALVIRSKA